MLYFKFWKNVNILISLLITISFYVSRRSWSSEPCHGVPKGSTERHSEWFAFRMAVDQRLHRRRTKHG